MSNLIADSVLLQGGKGNFREGLCPFKLPLIKRQGGTDYIREAKPLFNSSLVSPPFDSTFKERGKE